MDHECYNHCLRKCLFVTMLVMCICAYVMFGRCSHILCQGISVLLVRTTKGIDRQWSYENIKATNFQVLKKKSGIMLHRCNEVSVILVET